MYSFSDYMIMTHCICLSIAYFLPLQVTAILLFLCFWNLLSTSIISSSVTSCLETACQSQLAVPIIIFRQENYFVIFSLSILGYTNLRNRFISEEPLLCKSNFVSLEMAAFVTSFCTIKLCLSCQTHKPLHDVLQKGISISKINSNRV